MKNLIQLSKSEKLKCIPNLKEFEENHFVISDDFKDLFTRFKVVEGKVFFNVNTKYEFDVSANFNGELINQYQKDYSDYLFDTYFCFGRDSFGNLFVINNDTKKVLFFNHDENKYLEISDSIVEFIENLIEDEANDDDDEIIAESFSFDPDLFK